MSDPTYIWRKTYELKYLRDGLSSCTLCLGNWYNKISEGSFVILTGFYGEITMRVKRVAKYKTLKGFIDREDVAKLLPGSNRRTYLREFRKPLIDAIRRGFEICVLELEPA